MKRTEKERAKFRHGGRLRWACVLSIATGAGGHARAVRAQPEKPPTEEETSSSETVFTFDEEGGEVVDPEISSSETTSSSEPDGFVSSDDEPTADLFLTLHTRLALDTGFEGSHEDVFEALQTATFEVVVRRSEDLRFAVGLRGRWLGATRKDDRAPGSRDRYELDAVPTAGYVDATLVPGLHVRAGYQNVPLGRFDLFSATNFLSAADLRSGPLMPVPNEIAQPGIRIDVQPTSWLSMSSIYLPFFQPHLVAIVRSDYALFALAEQEARRQGSDDATRAVEDAFSRSGLSALSEATFRFFGPEPGFEEPQGAIRTTARGDHGEVSITVGTALERLPALSLSPALDQFITGEGTLDALLADPRPVQVEYNRFGIVTTDAAIEAGPIQLGIEAAYMRGRTLIATSPDAAPRPERADLAHGGFRFEVVSGQSFLVGAEAFVTYALSRAERPLDYIPFEDGRFLRGGGALLRWSPGDGPIALELGGVAFSGPTWLAAPRIEWGVAENFFLEAGAFILEGPSPGPFGTAGVSLGGIYDDNDQVFLGARWLP